MECEKVAFSGHAVRRMFERAIAETDVSEVISSGEEVIGEYPSDTPYPSYLLLGFPGGKPLHDLIGMDDEAGSCYVVTTYNPSLAFWNDDYRTRRESS